MKAVWLQNPTEPKDIKIADTDSPILEVGQALVHVHAAGVNPSDVKYAANFAKSTLYPRIPGRDFAGIVVEGPSELIGSEVFGTGGDLGAVRHGTHAEYIELPVSALTLKPSTLSMAEAASIGVPYITAYKAIVELGQLTEDETLLILGGSGAVGTAAAQIAKWRGACVISTVRKGESGTTRRSYADIVITLPDDDIVESAMAATQNEGVDLVLNAVGEALFDAGVNALAHKGRMVFITGSDDHPVTFNIRNFYKQELQWFGLDTLELTASDCAMILDVLAPGFESGDLGSEVSHILPFSEAAKAYEMVAKGGFGKVAVSMVEEATA